MTLPLIAGVITISCAVGFLIYVALLLADEWDEMRSQELLEELGALQKEEGPIELPLDEAGSLERNNV
ncbi:hypothetical protein Q7C18_07300 [Nesterenkonia sp. CL21]|uniref:hypothetical protein n=1 Tax=Nesterenkonia sp. CL21 TaxID=3064894 RepID=UPI00287A2879|nr:hypothetical protein [Nesterenkonia sp. CL21]MDS2172494.1 hypothetical protein [Nesterenkonia sp. CL21]